MQIKGLIKTTLLDYPDKVACVVFTGGCNFRCPFCHNAELVLAPNTGGTVDEEEFFAFLKKRKGILDGVCVTGGEPLMHAGLSDFLARIKAEGFLVKLDTNGSFPEKLLSLMGAGLVDYVAIDIKNSPEKYPLTCGGADFLREVMQSSLILMQGKIPFEFRTTVVNELHTPLDFEKIGEWISGAERYFLQPFRNSENVIVGSLTPPPQKMLEECLNIAKKYVPNTSIRGV